MKTNTVTMRLLFGMLIVILAAMLAACQPGEKTPTATLMPELKYEDILSMTPPAVSETPQVSPELSNEDILSQTPPAPGEGMTFEDLRSRFPPPPQELKIKAVEGGVRLDWSAAAVVTIAHEYSDTAEYYNIYRRTAAENDAMLIATSKDLFYVDKSVVKGTTYFYAVSSVHEGPLEGDRTDEVTILVK
jgi:hypothetical protein